MSPGEFTQVCRGYAERRRSRAEQAWQIAAFVGQLFAKGGLKPLDELIGGGGRQSAAQLNLMFEMFSAQVKTPIRKSSMN